MTLYDSMKRLGLKLKAPQLLKIGLIVVMHYRMTRNILKVDGKYPLPEKIQVKLRSRRNKKDFFWWVADYPDDFGPEMDKIMAEEAAKLTQKKKRPRLHEQPVVKAQPKS